MTMTTTHKPSRRTAALTVLAALTIAAIPIGGCSITGKAGHRLAVASGRAPSTTLYVSAQAPVGPTRSVEGTPAGFRHDTTGARAAAISYVNDYGPLITAEFITRNDTIDRISSTRYAPTLKKQLGSAVSDFHDELQKKDVGVSDITLTFSPISAIATTGSPMRVRVKVWSVGVMSLTGSTIAIQTWQQIQLVLVWERGDWRIDDWSEAVGPTPKYNGSDLSPSSEVARVQDWPAATSDHIGTVS